MHLCKILVESGAAIFATTISDVETAADKCEEMEEGFIQCSQFLYGKTSLCGAQNDLSSHTLHFENTVEAIVKVKAVFRIKSN